MTLFPNYYMDKLIMKNLLIFIVVFLVACQPLQHDDTELLKEAVLTASDFSPKTINIVSDTDVEWTPLNPARGDKSPKAGTLWGDRAAAGATGFLVEFVDGFSSPPHIHNVSYRGVVISGLVHNDDPKAENLWLPAGSFWTQPAGEAHITAAKGQQNIAYIEIDSGPYLVRPAAQAFDNGERPVNVDKSNLVWLNAKDINWTNQSNGVEIAFLWGNSSNNALGGTFVKLPAGFSGSIDSSATEFRAVVIQGQVKLNDSTLNPGSYFGALEPSKYPLSVNNEAVIYIRSNDKFSIVVD